MTKDEAIQQAKNYVDFCANKECGDPVANPGGTPHFTKRQLIYQGYLDTFWSGSSHVYQCPVCKTKHHYIVLKLGVFNTSHVVQEQKHRRGK